MGECMSMKILSACSPLRFKIIKHYFSLLILHDHLVHAWVLSRPIFIFQEQGRNLWQGLCEDLDNSYFCDTHNHTWKIRDWDCTSPEIGPDSGQNDIEEYN